VNNEFFSSRRNIAIDKSGRRSSADGILDNFHTSYLKRAVDFITENYRMMSPYVGGENEFNHTLDLGSIAALTNRQFQNPDRWTDRIPQKCYTNIL